MREEYPDFIYLTVEEVKEIHKTQLEIIGGLSGIRSLSGLKSAVEQPKATFAGQDLYPDICEKAAVYAFHLAESQAFVDANKRVAVITAVTFLKLNGHEIPENSMELYKAMIKIANKEMDKDDLANLFRKLINKGKK